ncbi:hypothetical protein NKJ51_29300 [Mesorhizobium sp. M0134]|uniref:hypothetical protein n=1 Tax=Mesorhizobium sp. M0134 TaxID=2956889 RepID=UPI00333DB0F9
MRVDRLDPPCLVIGQRGEFVFAGVVRQVATILVQETEEQTISRSGMSIKASTCCRNLIVALQKSGFVGKSRSTVR